MDTSIQTAVLATPIPNAFALPGGKVYLFSGLLAKADNADEIAGVLAHELGHLKHRDNTRNLIYNGGTSFLIGLLFGDVTGSGALIFASRSLVTASYSREAEQNADTFSIDVMHRLGRSPKPMGELLFRVTGKQVDKTLSILSNHPLTEDRLKRMSDEDRPPTGPPLLTAEEWTALKAICIPQTRDHLLLRSLTFRTQARTSASTSGSTALTSSTVMPALMRGSYRMLSMILVVDVEESHRDLVVEHGPGHRVGIVDRPQRLQQFFIGAVEEDEIALVDGEDHVGVLDFGSLVLAKAGQALRIERASDLAGPLLAVETLDGGNEIAVAHQRDHDIGVVDGGGHRDVEMLQSACRCRRRLLPVAPFDRDGWRRSANTRTGPSYLRMRSTRPAR